MKDKTPSFSNPFEFDMLLLEPVHDMMREGIRLDQDVLKELQDEAIEQWRRDQDKLDEIVGVAPGTTFNAAGTKTVPDFLYKHLGLPKKTKKGSDGKRKVTANEDALRELMATCKMKVDDHKTLQGQYKWMTGYLTCFYILKVRGVRKMISSYLGMHIEKGQLAGEYDLCDPDGRLRSSVAVGGTKTMRFSHSKTGWGTGFNVATIPRKLRRMFVASDGKEMAEFDLNRGESWVYAHLSEDPELLRIHTEGLDFHSETAHTISEVFEGDILPVEWIVEHKNGKAYKIRFLGKRVNHASSYRMGPFKGAATINEESEETGIVVTVREFAAARKLWLERYSGIKPWWRETENTLHETRTMVTPYGRRLQFHGLRKKGDKRNREIYKEATAFVPQATSVEYLNRGFLRVYHNLVKTGAWGLKVLAQTHDSILVEYNQNHREEAIPVIAAMLESELTIKGRTFTIPIEANYGHSWGEMEEYPLRAA